LRLFSFGGYGLALAALALEVFGAIECPPRKTTQLSASVKLIPLHANQSSKARCNFNSRGQVARGSFIPCGEARRDKQIMRLWWDNKAPRLEGRLRFLFLIQPAFQKRAPESLAENPRKLCAHYSRNFLAPIGFPIGP